MITNNIKEITNNIISVPSLVRADEEGWVPTFELWSTKIDTDTSYIECNQFFSPIKENFLKISYDEQIGYYNNEGKFIINWKALIDTEDISRVNAFYKGKIRGTTWRKRYCTYFGEGSHRPWLHSILFDFNLPGYEIHHSNGASFDNRKRNLHRLPASEHKAINHPGIEERKKMFADPAGYWQKRKAYLVEEFILELALITNDEARNDFIRRFAIENKELTIEILEVAKIMIRLNGIKNEKSENRRLNPHLSKDYLDAYDLDKYLNKYGSKQRMQLRLF